MLINLVRAKVRDDAERLSDVNDYQPAIDAALERYSKHRPKPTVADLTGTGTSDLVLPVGWLDGFSRVVRVEYPVGDVPESLIDSAGYALYQAPTTLKLRLLDATPAVTETVRLTYTLPRVEATVISGDLDAVACLAASICLRTLAALHGQNSDPTIQADSVDYGSKADQFRRLADSLEEKFNAHLGINPKGGVTAASATAAAPRSSRARTTH